MKKLIGTAMLAALLATSAFAELSMGAWIRTLVAPVAFDGEDVKAGWANSWGGIRNARISFNWTSDDEKIGMMYDIYGDGSSGFSAGDYRAAWYKPADWVKFMVGHIDNGYTMRSDLAYGSWAWMRPNNWMEGDEGITFNIGNFNGLQVELFPVEGLQILGRLALPADGGWTDAYKMFEQSTFAAGYTIGNIGTVKVAWNGSGARKYKNQDEVHAAGWQIDYKDKNNKDAHKYYATMEDGKKALAALKEQKAQAEAKVKGVKALDKGEEDLLNELENALNGTTSPKWATEVKASGEEKYYGDIQAAFDLTAVENLFVTVGVKVSLASDKYKELGGANFAFPGMVVRASDKPDLFNTFKGAVGASYQILDNLKVSASYAIFLLENKGKKCDDPAMQFGVGVDVGLTDSLGLSADFRAMLPGNKVDPIYSFLVGVDWGFSGNGQLGIGFQGVIAAGEKAPARSATDDDPAYTASVFQARPDKFSFAVPIKFSYWF
ncbi:MAG: hypothetical protein K2J68_08505 [Treponemataceae bacterium]|nr:hypothetical protein [Treponemataceae bacterium]